MLSRDGMRVRRDQRCPSSSPSRRRCPASSETPTIPANHLTKSGESRTDSWCASICLSCFNRTPHRPCKPKFGLRVVVTAKQSCQCAFPADHPFVIGPTSVVLHRSEPTKPIAVRFWSRDGRTLTFDRIDTSAANNVVAVIVREDNARVARVNLTLSDIAGTSEDQEPRELRIYFWPDSDPYVMKVHLLP